VRTSVDDWADPLLLNGYATRNARRSPDRVALAEEQRHVTYAELDERVNRLANALRSLGVEQGDRVALLLPNGIEYAECLLAVCRLGAIAAPVNTRLTVAEVSYIFDDLRPTLVVAHGELLTTAQAAQHDVGSVKALVVVSGPGSLGYDELLAGAGPEPPAVDVGPGDPAFILYTSGTTGQPKGAVLSHAGYVVNSLSVLAQLHMADPDEWRHIGVPMFHTGGVNSLVQQLILGGTSLISEPKNFDGAKVVDLFERFPVATAFFTPTQWEQVCQAPELDSRRLRLRRLVWGTSNTPRAVLDLMAAAFPGLPVFAQFGQTEMTGTTCTLVPEFASSKLGSVGRPLPHVQLRLVNEDMDDVKPGDVGEIVYQGPAVMREYWQDAEATATAFRGGWFHSGDLGRFDEDGFLYVVDRLKDMIVSGGENIYCLEVETALQSHPKVAQVAVVGVPHEKWVETPRAVVVPVDPKDPPSYEELLVHLEPRLASYKKPTSMQLVEALPRNSMGKVLRHRLKELYTP